MLILATFIGSLYSITGYMTVVGLLNSLHTLFKLTTIISYTLRLRKTGWILMYILAVVVCLHVFTYVGDPFGWKTIKEP